MLVLKLCGTTKVKRLKKFMVNLPSTDLSGVVHGLDMLASKTLDNGLHSDLMLIRLLDYRMTNLSKLHGILQINSKVSMENHYS